MTISTPDSRKAATDLEVKLTQLRLEVTQLKAKNYLLEHEVLNLCGDLRKMRDELQRQLAERDERSK